MADEKKSDGRKPSVPLLPPQINPNLEEESQEESSRRMDPEIRVMGQMIRLLDGVEEQAREAMVQYLYGRYVERPRTFRYLERAAAPGRYGEE